MPRLIQSLFLAGAIPLFSGLAEAGETIGVVATIKPVHSLVAGVMQGVGTPHLIVKGGGSPHTYNLKPSDAKALENAKAVFWVGEELENFLKRSIHTLAKNAEIVWLIDAQGLARLSFREGGAFEGYEDAANPAHAQGHEGHDHGSIDMHVWLDPVNAKAMVREIAKALGEADPSNATAYKANAAALEGKLDSLNQEISHTLAPVKHRKFVVFHDGYQYFEKRYGLSAAGAITASPDTLPGAKRIRDIKSRVKAIGASCVFAEPQFQPKLLRAVIEGASAKAAILDPLGADLEDGPELYFTLMRNMAKAMKDCLSPAG